MRSFSTTLLVAALSTTAMPALAQAPAKPAAAAPPAASGPPPSDVRCLMDMFILAQQPDPKAKQTGQAGVLFFAGRLSKGGAGPDLAGAMKTQLPTMQQQQVQGELPRCGAMLQTTMRTVEGGFNSLRPPAPPAPAAGAPAAPPPATPAPK